MSKPSKKVVKRKGKTEERKEVPVEALHAIPKTLKEQMDLALKLPDSELAGIDEKAILEMRKNLNPYGRTIEGSNKHLSFSVTQISHEWWKKFITTSMIAFLFRKCNEWRVPNGVPVVAVYDYLDDKTKVDTPELTIKKGDKSAIYDYEFNREMMAKRMIVTEFLEEIFQFNPDEHVRSAYKPNPQDESRTIIDTMAARLACKHLAKKDAKFRAEMEEKTRSLGITKYKKVKRVIKNKKTGETRTEIVEVPYEEPVAPRKPSSQEKLSEDAPKDSDVKDTVYNVIPPHDVFAHFKRYYQENYEELRDATTNLYCEKPDLELAINPYAWHDTKADADNFVKQHSDEVIAEIFTADSGKWNFIDCFKAQREGVQFYNKNTAVLEEIVKQIERDEKLGQDLMKKRVEKEKKKNVIESGPDAENFKKWRSENKEIEQLGAKYIGDMADEDTPENAIEIPIWRIAKGGTELTKEKMYSMAEAPTFVKEAQDKAIASGDMKVKK